jgi:hypothetical protein
MRIHTFPAHRRQHGTTLFEALVAVLVLAVGMLTVARVQTHLRAGSDLARERSEAVRLAQEDIESLRGFAVLAASAGERAYDDIADGSHSADSSAGRTSYLVTRRIGSAGAPHAKAATVAVSWLDRHGNPQQLALDSIIAGSDPAYGGALGLARGARVGAPFGRSVQIPVAAMDLGDGRSAFKPVSHGTVALVFDNVTGLLAALCTGVADTTATRDLTAADLGSCEVRSGVLLSGSVRFSSASPPDASQPNDPSLPLAVSLTLTGGTYPRPPTCEVEPMKTVRYSANGSLRIEVVPVAATAAARGLAGWADTGERHLAYHCVVAPLASGRWSGRTALLPDGWTIGTATADRRVCRYSSDLDGSGAIDSNREHPASYVGVTGSLAHQNFLVIAGSEACPAGQTTQVTGSGADVFADLGTVQHQP